MRFSNILPVVGRTREWLAAAALVATLSGCGARPSAPDTASLPAQEYSGHLTVTDRAFWFRPCGAAENTRWWVTVTGSSVRQLQDARTSGRIVPGEPAFVRLRAAATDEKVVGPGGPALLVRELLEARPARPSDCGSP